jgi:hypothetical protein
MLTRICLIRNIIILTSLLVSASSSMAADNLDCVPPHGPYSGDNVGSTPRATVGPGASGTGRGDGRWCVTSSGSLMAEDSQPSSFAS